MLNPQATLVLVGGPKRRLAGPLGHIVKVRLAALRGSQKAVFFAANFNGPDLEVLRELLESGSVKPVVERCYELGEVPTLSGIWAKDTRKGRSSSTSEESRVR